jgi:DNA-binding IclR family transcriptional regulator
MAPAKAHPYLVSFGKLGLIAQDSASGHYGLGPLAMQLGLISLQQFDPVRLATARLPGLAQAMQQTVGITVWGAHGPTVVRTEEAPSPVHVTMRHGAVMSLRGTASGRLFAAHLPRPLVREALRAAGAGTLDKAFEEELATIRRQGLAQAVNAVLPGVSGLAAPVFDGNGTLVLALTAIGATAHFDTHVEGEPARALKRCATELSAQLGAPGAVTRA